MSNKQNCCLCSQISGHKENDLISKLLKDKKYVRRVAFESEHFAVIPSLGPLVEGHVLLCPKAHMRSFSNLKKEYEKDFRGIKKYLTKILNSLFKAPIHYFEHGMSNMGSHIVCSTEHAHMHFIPTSLEVLDIINNSMNCKTIRPDLSEIKKSVSKEKEYLYYESPDHHAIISVADKGTFPSQLLRKIFAESMDSKTQWDWRESPRPEVAHRIFRIIRSETIHAAAIMK